MHDEDFPLENISSCIPSAILSAFGATLPDRPPDPVPFRPPYLSATVPPSDPDGWRRYPLYDVLSDSHQSRLRSSAIAAWSHVRHITKPAPPIGLTTVYDVIQHQVHDLARDFAMLNTAHRSAARTLAAAAAAAAIARRRGGAGAYASQQFITWQERMRDVASELSMLAYRTAAATPAPAPVTAAPPRAVPRMSSGMPEEPDLGLEVALSTCIMTAARGLPVPPTLASVLTTRAERHIPTIIVAGHTAGGAPLVAEALAPLTEAGVPVLAPAGARVGAGLGAAAGGCSTSLHEVFPAATPACPNTEVVESAASSSQGAAPHVSFAPAPARTPLLTLDSGVPAVVDLVGAQPAGAASVLWTTLPPTRGYVFVLPADASPLLWLAILHVVSPILALALGAAHARDVLADQPSHTHDDVARALETATAAAHALRKLTFAPSVELAPFVATPPAASTPARDPGPHAHVADTPAGRVTQQLLHQRQPALLMELSASVKAPRLPRGQGVVVDVDPPVRPLRRFASPLEGMQWLQEAAGATPARPTPAASTALAQVTAGQPPRCAYTDHRATAPRVPLTHPLTQGWNDLTAAAPPATPAGRTARAAAALASALVTSAPEYLRAQAAVRAGAALVVRPDEDADAVTRALAALGRSGVPTVALPTVMEIVNSGGEAGVRPTCLLAPIDATDRECRALLAYAHRTPGTCPLCVPRVWTPRRRTPATLPTTLAVMPALSFALPTHPAAVAATTALRHRVLTLHAPKPAPPLPPAPAPETAHTLALAGAARELAAAAARAALLGRAGCEKARPVDDGPLACPPLPPLLVGQALSRLTDGRSHVSVMQAAKLQTELSGRAGVFGVFGRHMMVRDLTNMVDSHTTRAQIEADSSSTVLPALLVRVAAEKLGAQPKMLMTPAPTLRLAAMMRK